MLIVTLLITILLITFLAKPLNANNFRLAIGGIYGILFLVVWPYFKFFAEITELEERTITIGFGLLSVLAVGLIFLPVISKIGKLGAASLFILFIVTIAVSFAFESQIKINIGKLSGYFSGEYPIKTNQSSNVANKFTNSIGGYAVSLPPTWQQQKLMPIGLPYYVLLDNEVKKAEFRPKCFHQLDVALPEMIQGIIEHSQSNGASEVQKNCFIWRDSYYSCLIRSTGNMSQQVKSRWQWFGVNYDKQQGIELDFVLYENADRIIRDIEMVIASLEPISLPTPVPRCLGVAAWF